MSDQQTRTVAKSEITVLAQEIVAMLKKEPTAGATVVALHGDLGAGKTTLVQAIGAHLGVIEHITSPTFTIMKQYETTDSHFETLVHMDAYRIDDLLELGPLRFDALLAEPKTLLCIEWAEKIKAALPANILTIALEIADEEARTVHISRG